MNHETEGNPQDGLRVISRQPDGSLLLSNGSALTRREIEILQQLTFGRTNPEIGRDLFLTVHTIEFYATRIYQKLGVRNRTQAAMVSAKISLLDRAISLLEPQTSREPQDASRPESKLASATERPPGRKTLTTVASIGAGLASAVVGLVTAVSVLSGAFPGVPLLTNEAKPEHCVAQPDHVIWSWTSEPEPLLPKRPVVCYSTFNEAIQSVGADPDDFRPPQ